MKKHAITLTAVAAIMLTSFGCGDKDDNTTPIPTVDTALATTILTDFSTNVAQATYNDLAAKTNAFYLMAGDLATGEATAIELEACRNTWKSARESWEQSESFLFGPVSTNNIDPRIDTWPVDFENLTAQLNSETGTFTDEYIDNLDDALKGFHPIEYIIFGEDGEKEASDITPIEMEYLLALAKNLKTLTADAKESWDPTADDNYYTVFVNAGKGSAVYETQLAAFEEVVNAMIGICGEVGEEKIDNVFKNPNPAQFEESPYSKNSIIDFTNNIKGIKNVYLGKYNTDGKGLEDLVRQYNLQLDGTIKLKLETAITALENITVPFSEAITSQPLKVQAAVDAIGDLAGTLDDELLPFVQAHSK